MKVAKILITQLLECSIYKIKLCKLFTEQYFRVLFDQLIPFYQGILNTKIGFVSFLFALLCFAIFSTPRIHIHEVDDNHQNFLKHSHERQARQSDDNQLRGQKSENYHSYSLTHCFREVFLLSSLWRKQWRKSTTYPFNKWWHWCIKMVYKPRKYKMFYDNIVFSYKSWQLIITSALWVTEKWSRSVMSDSLRPHGL